MAAWANGRAKRMRILLVEDDVQLAEQVVTGLGEQSHIVEHAGNGQAGLDRAVGGAFDVLILDRMLPGIDGLSLIAAARQAGVVAPVLMLTARGSIEDRVTGLEAGADDYLIKPFAMSELAARVTALGRRPRSADRDGILACGSIRLDRVARAVTRNGRAVVLQPREFQLLEELMRNAGHIVTRAMLLKAVWRFSFDPETRIVESHVSRLRAKLNAGSGVDAIDTVRGEGYRVRIDA